jgi:predicted GTPase
MNAMVKRIENDEGAIELIKNKQVILIFGTTGAGKSTIANALIKGHKNIKCVNGIYEVKEPTIFNGEVIFNIGHSVKSATKVPKYCLFNCNNPDIFLVDGPGHNDTNVKQQYSNTTSIMTILNNSCCFSLLIIIDANQVY